MINPLEEEGHVSSFSDGLVEQEKTEEAEGRRIPDVYTWTLTTLDHSHTYTCSQRSGRRKNAQRSTNDGKEHQK